MKNFRRELLKKLFILLFVILILQEYHIYKLEDRIYRLESKTELLEQDIDHIEDYYYDFFAKKLGTLEGEIDSLQIIVWKKLGLIKQVEE